tara:strand:- start:1924 stop:2130 length:207 start_codon:yes stop_codon:yes gene_type:complete
MGKKQEITEIPIEEVANLVGRTVNTVYAWAKAEQIPSTKFMGSRTFYRERIEAWLQGASIHTGETDDE